MKITNSVVCETSKGCLYKQIKPQLVGKHAFPLMGFVCSVAQITHAFVIRVTFLNLFVEEKTHMAYVCKLLKFDIK